MFNNIGGKIKGLAMTLCWLGIIGFVIFGIVQMSISKYMIGTGILTMVIGCFGSWIGSWLLYGFGELIEQQTITTDYLGRIGDLITDIRNDTEDKTVAKKDTVGIAKEAPIKIEDTFNNADRVAKVNINPDSENLICPLCGTDQKADRNVCWHCGAKFEKTEFNI